MGKRRGNKEGCISKRKDGRWLVTVQTGINDDGKPKRVYKYAKTQSEAIEILRKLNNELEMGIDMKTGNITVGEWCKVWLDNYKTDLASSTRTSYANNIRIHINQHIGGIQLKKLNREEIQFMINKIYNDGENSLSLLIKVYNVLQGAINKAIEIGMISNNPCRSIVFPKKNSKKIRVLTIEEQNDFIKELSNWDSKALFMTYLFTGARLGELPPLKWRDINLDERFIVINKKAIVVHDYYSENKKTAQIVENFCKSESSTRDIYINAKLVDVLKEHKELQKKRAELLKEEWNEDNLVFPTGNGTIPYLRNIDEKFHRIIKKVGIEDFTIHGLRHTYATRLFEADVEIKVISGQLGHKDVKTTYNIYVHVMPKKQLFEIDKLDALDIFIP